MGILWSLKMEEGRRGRGRPPRARIEMDASLDTLEEEIVEQGEAYNELLPDPGYERVIVARGRTLLFPDPTKTKIVREGEDGKPVRAPIAIEFKEGMEVTLEASEAERLIGLGIVHRPGEPQMVPAALSDGSRVVEIGTPRGQSPVNQAART